VHPKNRCTDRIGPEPVLRKPKEYPNVSFSFSPFRFHHHTLGIGKINPKKSLRIQSGKVSSLEFFGTIFAMAFPTNGGFFRFPPMGDDTTKRRRWSKKNK
jgi:hypothetical protein